MRRYHVLSSAKQWWTWPTSSLASRMWEQWWLGCRCDDSPCASTVDSIPNTWEDPIKVVVCVQCCARLHSDLQWLVIPIGSQAEFRIKHANSFPKHWQVAKLGAIWSNPRFKMWEDQSPKACALGTIQIQLMKIMKTLYMDVWRWDVCAQPDPNVYLVPSELWESVHHVVRTGTLPCSPHRASSRVLYPSSTNGTLEKILIHILLWPLSASNSDCEVTWGGSDDKTGWSCAFSASPLQLGYFQKFRIGFFGEASCWTYLRAVQYPRILNWNINFQFPPWCP